MKKILLAVFLLIGVISMAEAEEAQEGLAKATFAGGCFWCMEPPFEKLDGVHAVVSGYTGGEEVNPGYYDVAGGKTGHAEAVEITYDPSKVSYDILLDVYWRNIDPTQKNGQFADKGKQYRTAIFYHDDEQKDFATRSKEALANAGVFKKPIVVSIEPAQPFYPAEEYHQDYYKKNPDHYQNYRHFSGRGPFIEKVWGK